MTTKKKKHKQQNRYKPAQKGMPCALNDFYTISLRTKDSKMIRALIRMANEEERKPGKMATILVREALVAGGYL